MKLQVFWITMAVTVVAAVFAGLIVLSDPFYTNTSETEIGLRTNPYADTCVVTVTHPDPELQFKRLDESCEVCRYYFCIVDKNSPMGTHAEDAVLRIYYEQGPVDSNGIKIPGRRLDGYEYQSIRPIEFDEIRFGEIFYIEGPCPKCMLDDQRYITLRLTFWECDGQQGLGYIYFDLKTQRVLDYIPGVPPTDIDCAPGDPCQQQTAPDPCGC